MVTVRGWSRPVLSGAASAATSTKLGIFNELAREETLLESMFSPGFVSASTHGADSLARDTFQELVALVETKETVWGFSTWKKSLSSQSAGLGSTVFKASEIVSTVCLSLPSMT